MTIARQPQPLEHNSMAPFAERLHLSTHSNPVKLVVKNSQHEGWLTLEAAVSEALCVTPTQLLEFNRWSRGGVKACVGYGEPALIRLEVPLDGDADSDTGLNVAPVIDTMIARMIARIENGVADLISGTLEDPDALAVSVSVFVDKAPDIASLCEESAWPCQLREPNRWMVTLETAPLFTQAEVTIQGDEVLIKTSLTEWFSESQVTNSAISRLLLAANAHLRMAYSASMPTDAFGSHRAELVVRFNVANAATYLSHSLASLSLGIRMLQREIEALLCPEIASCFLAMTGGDSVAK